MPEFRKWILALAAVTLTAGLASAQVGTPTGGAPGTPAGPNLSCTSNAAVTPTLRAEGYTELSGDIVITCTGGPLLALGAPIPTANVTVFLNTQVTSRLLTTTTTSFASEALLLIDEPNSGLTGYGPSVAQTPCGATNVGVGAGAGGCSEVVGTSLVGVTATPYVPVSSSCATPAVTACTSVGANVFQGIVSGNSVSFYGIPVLPPTTAGVSRVFRITNIRVNANGASAGGAGTTPIYASISNSGSTSLPITTAQLTVGFVQPGLNTTNTLLRNGANLSNLGGSGTTLNQCSGVSSTSNSSAVGVLQYQDNFPGAFKTRFQQTAGYGSSTVLQNVPGTIYASESGFMLSSLTSGGTTAVGNVYTAGVADYGTRLKAVFTNVPSGVSLYVSTRDVSNNFISPTGTPSAVLVAGEGASDGSNVLPPSPISPPLATQTSSFVGQSSSQLIPVAPVITNAGTGAAVWEVVQSTPTQIQTLSFSVYLNYSASPATNSPAAPSTISVTMSFAPTPSGGLFTSSTGATASAILTIPRFSDSLDITKTLANFALCTTDLLYPYVVNTGGFDTGLAIANTTSDPFGTTAQVGTCTLNFYGASAPSAAFVTPSIATGTVYANLASTVSPGFSGYIIAVCNFQFAHGFAFVSDVGARNLAMGYLALIIPSTSRSAAEALNN